MASQTADVEVVGVRENKLLGRREVSLRIAHVGEGTPTRKYIRSRVAEMLKVDVDAVYVRSIKTEYGAGISLARVHVYDDPARAREVEPEYIIARNADRGGEGK